MRFKTEGVSCFETEIFSVSTTRKWISPLSFSLTLVPVSLPLSLSSSLMLADPIDFLCIILFIWSPDCSFPCPRHELISQLIACRFFFCASSFLLRGLCYQSTDSFPMTPNWNSYSTGVDFA